MLDDLDRDGYAWLRGFLNAPETARLAETLSALAATLPRDDARAAAGLRIPQAAFPQAQDLLERARPDLAAALGSVRLVRVLLFDKSADAPWFVRWHRDTMIPVREHRPSTELTAPSVKAGVPHVRATPAILSKMLALRLHLDPSTSGNGPLKVLPGSHRIDRLDSPAAQPPPDRDARAVICLAAPGDLLLMRPLLLHASPKPADGARRRVLQLEITADQSLPDGYAWAD
ncbi:MAG: phytanoyl-CoA dioxygenase family protein [Planctomycetota bacterium]|nr:phytanoyl-CoA dioxygenase family protein [Planctomycetota bacterium]